MTKNESRIGRAIFFSTIIMGCLWIIFFILGGILKFIFDYDISNNYYIFEIMVLISIPILASFLGWVGYIS